MSTQFDKIPIGVLNPISLNTNTIIFDSRQDSSVNHLRKVIREVSNPNSFDTSTGFIGIVLYAPPGIIAPSPGTNFSMIESVTKYGGINLGQIIVRVPELHAFLPEPENEEDFKRIIQHPIFTAINDGVPPPKVGDLVIVDFKNRANRTDGLYISKVKDAGVMNGSTSTGTSAQSFINNGLKNMNNKSPSPPGRTENYQATSLLKRNDSWNLLPSDIQYNLNQLTQNIETIHQYFEQLGLTKDERSDSKESYLPNIKNKIRIGHSDAFDNPANPIRRADGTIVHKTEGEHPKGRAIDIVATYRDINDKKVDIDRTLVWAVCMKLRSTGHLKPGGVGAYIRKNSKTNLYGWYSIPHYDIRGINDNWYWMPGKGNKLSGPPKEFTQLVDLLPEPLPNVKKWSEQNIK